MNDQLRAPKIDSYEIDRPIVWWVPGRDHTKGHYDVGFYIFPIMGEKLRDEFAPGLVGGVVA